MEYTELVTNQLEQYEGWADGARKMNEEATLADEFKVDRSYFYHASILTTPCSVTIHVDNADEVIESLVWFRTRGYKSTGYKDDSTSKRRNYTLVNAENEKKIKLIAYFGGGKCEFVETGEVTHVKTMPAIEAHDVPVLELRCEGEALPNGEEKPAD